VKPATVPGERRDGIALPVRANTAARALLGLIWILLPKDFWLHPSMCSP
jgi:hypothetical protein